MLQHRLTPGASHSEIDKIIKDVQEFQAIEVVLLASDLPALNERLSRVAFPSNGHRRRLLTLEASMPEDGESAKIMWERGHITSCFTGLRRFAQLAPSDGLSKSWWCGTIRNAANDREWRGVALDAAWGTLLSEEEPAKKKTAASGDLDGLRVVSVHKNADFVRRYSNFVLPLQSPWRCLDETVFPETMSLFSEMAANKITIIVSPSGALKTEARGGIALTVDEDGQGWAVGLDDGSLIQGALLSISSRVV